MLDRTYANLWSCLTSAVYRRQGAPDERGEELLTHLAHSARWGGQELELRVTEEGWEVRIFSCYERGESGEEEIILTIPRDHQLQPRLQVVRSD